MRRSVVAFLAGVASCLLVSAAVAPVRAQDVPAIPWTALTAAVERAAALEQQLIDRDNEIVHQQADLANCKATVDSLTLTNKVADLVKRYESVYGGTWTWDDRQRRVVKMVDTSKDSKEK